MDEVRINAAIAEMNNTIQMLMQRNINLAGELAVAQAGLSATQAGLAEVQKELADLKEANKPDFDRPN